MEETRPAECVVNLDHDLQNTQFSRIGQIGEEFGSNWDNGFYTTCDILNVSAKCLIDSGSTLSLLSNRVFEKIDINVRPTLEQHNVAVHDVTGSDLRVYGQFDFNVKIGTSEYKHSMLVCEMSPEVILGQDFLLKHVKKIDYCRQQLHTETDVIHCWTGGENCMVCRVLVQQKITVPANHTAWVPVDIPNSEHLAETGIIQTSPMFSKADVCLVEGIINTRQGKDPTKLNVVNHSDDPVTLYPCTELGVCESIHETENDPTTTESARCAFTAEKSTTGQSMDIPEHLKDMIERSSTHLNPEQQHSFKQLILKYQGTFASSSADLGFTDRVKHKIDTGNARPTKQAPRRLPFGKRNTEREEIQKMLDRGVIEPSASPWASPVVLVTKKDGGVRFCVDYRKLNEVTVIDAIPYRE